MMRFVLNEVEDHVHGSPGHAFYPGLVLTQRLAEQLRQCVPGLPQRPTRLGCRRTLAIQGQRHRRTTHLCERSSYALHMRDHRCDRTPVTVGRLRAPQPPWQDTHEVFAYTEGALQLLH